MSLDTDKHWIRELAGICAAMGLNKVVMSPGSRCAPLVIAFNRHPEIECLSVIDERSAAFFALGMAQQLQQPVGLVCTSGTAVLNYAPAIAEAYYQRIPLVIFTADRPPELIDQNDGQTIRQHEIYRNYVKWSFQLPVEVTDESILQVSNNIIVEAIKTSLFPDKGPVHVNVPLCEPLYGLKEYEGRQAPAHIINENAISFENNALYNGSEKLMNDHFILNIAKDNLRSRRSNEVGVVDLGNVGAMGRQVSSKALLDEVEELKKTGEGNGMAELLTTWQTCARKLIVAGGYPPSKTLNTCINQLSKDPSVSIIAEVTSNLHGDHLIYRPDTLLAALEKEDALKYTELVPDILVTIGGGIVSKKLKTFLRNNPAKQHWHIDVSGQAIDTYGQLTHVIAIKPQYFIEYLNDHSNTNESKYSIYWHDAGKKASDRHDKILKVKNYNDLNIFSLVLSYLPGGSNLHLGNSTPIRYAGLFDPRPDVIYNCNRGTSGIDGTLSTAAGAARVNGKLTTIITGDLAFFYDSNALWNKNLPGNLRIIMINNGGGNIFRVIPGPSSLPELEDFFETRMDLNAEHIAGTYKLPYYFCDNLDDLKTTLPGFFRADSDKCRILEIKSPAEASAKAMREYLGIN